jgi:hypothetical protein
MTPRPVDYRWALDDDGYPVPIHLARRGKHFTCPLCGGPMIARRGEYVQHHFSHERESGCTPDGVSRAMIRRWVTIRVNAAREAGEPIRLRWRCPYCEGDHAGNLMSGVGSVVEGHTHDAREIDVALLSAEGKLCAAILVQGDDAPSPRTLRALVDERLAVLSLPLSFTPVLDDPLDWLHAATVHGGPCPNWERAAAHIVRQPATVRAVLVEMVSRPPGFFAGAVETIGGLVNMVQMGDWLVWLPVERWRDIVGGTLNTFDSNTHIYVQHWRPEAGGVIALYYVIIHETRAIGIRRYPPGQTPAARLGGAYQRRRTTALDVARELVAE